MQPFPDSQHSTVNTLSSSQIDRACGTSESCPCFVGRSALRGSLVGRTLHRSCCQLLAILVRMTGCAQAYGQATRLQPGKLFAWVQSGYILLRLGATAEATASFKQVLKSCPCYPPALMGSAEALLGSARRYIHSGILGELF